MSAALILIVAAVAVWVIVLTTGSVIAGARQRRREEAENRPGRGCSAATDDLPIAVEESTPLGGMGPE